MAETARKIIADAPDGLPARERVADLSRLLDEQADLLDERRAAFDRLHVQVLPDRIRHLWKFTDPRHLLPGDPVPVHPVAAVAEASAGTTARIVLQAGVAPAVHLSPAARAAGLVAAPINTFLELSHPVEAAGLVPSCFFHNLNDAFRNCGVRLELPRGAVLDEPVLVTVRAGQTATLPRIVVDAGEGARLTVVEEHVDGGEGDRVVGRTELHAAQDARLTHMLVQRWEDGVNGHLTVRGYAGRDADLRTTFVSLGGSRAKVELMTDLAGEGARSEMTGVAFCGDGQRFDHHTRHRHLAGRTWSNIDFKAVADGRSRSSYTGLIRIEEQARGSEAYQENRNLLLSENGRADSIPELEILNEDVSCSHGATVAPIDPEQVFYLQSRGLSPADAVRLVVQGFLAGVVDGLPPGVRDVVSDLIASRLDGLRGVAA